MEKIILERLLTFINNVQDENSMKNLRKTSYAEGYMACAKDVKDLIEMGYALGAQKKGA